MSFKNHWYEFNNTASLVAAKSNLDFFPFVTVPETQSDSVSDTICQQRNERKRILKISLGKQRERRKTNRDKAILCRNLLIENTKKRLQEEIKLENKSEECMLEIDADVVQQYYSSWFEFDHLKSTTTQEDFINLFLTFSDD